jgi:hypothetical protein
MQNMKQILKLPLTIAAAVVVLRVAVERAGASDAAANILSVVALHFLIAPVYFAIRVAIGGEPRPYFTLFKLIALYVVLTRLMILPVYWLARVYGWPQGRFGGLSGNSPFMGFFVIPFATAAFWIVASVIFGSIVGSLIIAVTRRFITQR